MIAVLDYQAGNLGSVRKALRAVDADVFTPTAASDLAHADGVIVPGVGHFAATSMLDETWRTAMRGLIAAGTPVLGICLGMQWLFDGSDEAPGLLGLGALPGHIRRLRTDRERGMKVPHVGWNTLTATTTPSRLLDGIEPRARVYFTHSFAAPITSACVASTTHVEPFAAAVERDSVYGLQFHPEQSGSVGLRILRTFAERCR